MHSNFSTLWMLCNAYDDMSSFNPRLKHQRCYTIAKEWMDKDEALWVESKLGLDPNGELKSTSLINMTHPSLEEALEKITPRVSNPRKILHIHEETSLELEKEDDYKENGP